MGGKPRIKYTVDLGVKGSMFSCSCTDSGTFIYKAKESNVKKKDGTLKKKYKEMPRYNVLIELDKEAEQDSNQWHSSISKLVKKILID